MNQITIAFHSYHVVQPLFYTFLGQPLVASIRIHGTIASRNESKSSNSLVVTISPKAWATARCPSRICGSMAHTCSRCNGVVRVARLNDSRADFHRSPVLPLQYVDVEFLPKPQTLRDMLEA